mgnify:CR=1 FL=1
MLKTVQVAKESQLHILKYVYTCALLHYCIYLLLKAADRQKSDTEGNIKNLQKRLEVFEQEKSQLLTDMQV